jgi:hypothetical protein
MMIQLIRLFVFFEASAFIAAALTHFGLLISGYEHLKAGIAETVIAVVLAIGLVFTGITPHSVRKIGLAAQGFALLGTLVGIFMIAIGIGPRTWPDITYHIGVVIVLAAGLFVARRTSTV